MRGPCSRVKLHIVGLRAIGGRRQPVDLQQSALFDLRPHLPPNAPQLPLISKWTLLNSSRTTNISLMSRTETNLEEKTLL